MRLKLEDHLLVIVMDEDDVDEAHAWKAAHLGHVFRLSAGEGPAIVLQGLGPEEDARRVPINITSMSPAPLDLVSNFAHTPFELDGVSYASIEGFWQGIKFTKDSDRRRVFALFGGAAKAAADDAPASDVITYADRPVRVGTFEHWALMEKACMAKFTQHAAAREALLSTGDRPIVHRVRRDSRTIPGVVMADIWMRIRERFQAEPRDG